MFLSVQRLHQISIAVFFHVCGSFNRTSFVIFLSVFYTATLVFLILRSHVCWVIKGLCTFQRINRKNKHINRLKILYFHINWKIKYVESHSLFMSNKLIREISEVKRRNCSKIWNYFSFFSLSQGM